MAVDGVPSSASRWISFKATISLVVLERPYAKRSEERIQEREQARYLVHRRICALTCAGFNERNHHRNQR